MSIILDVSNNNPITGPLLQASGAVALICKATEGDSFRDGTYPAHRALAKAAKIPFGGYLFLHPDSPGNEAEFFLKYAKPKPGDLQPIVDSETLTSGGMLQAAHRTFICLYRLKEAGYSPLLYSSTSMLEAMFHYQPQLTQYRIWQAQYAAKRSPLGHGATVVMWQFSQSYKVQNKRYDASTLFAPLQSLLIPKGVK